MPRRSPFEELHEAFVSAENARRAGAVAGASRPAATEPGSAAAATAARRAEVEWIPFGPDLPAGAAAGADASCRIVAGFGAVEAEYAAIRRGAAMRDAAERSTLRVRGRDRLDFLQRMLTQDLAPLARPGCRESFWLNRKGRIDADLLVVETGDQVILDLDVHAADPARESLGRFLFAEDAAIDDATGDVARISLHGPGAGAALERAGLGALSALPEGGAGAVDGVVAARRDQCGAPGYELFVPVAAAQDAWRALAAAARPIGWDAYNIARIEGGTPLFRVDFGPESLPHETGVVAARVSFRKGCYLGQEIVARMESLGAPKQVVVGFRCRGPSLPVAGAAIGRPGEALSTPVGAVTSSTASPMLGGAGIGFATVRSAVADAGRRLVAHADGAEIELEVAGPPRAFLVPAPERP